MSKVRRRPKPKSIGVILSAGTYRVAADRLGGLFSVEVPENTYGILDGRAPGAPHLEVAIVEINAEFYRVEVDKNNYTTAE